MNSRSCAACVGYMALCAFLIAPACPAFGANWYVRPGGAGVQNGKTWETAFATVTTGILEANPGDIVMVAQGHYHERIKVPRGVAVRGGYVLGTGGVWSRVMHSARLDGDNLGPVVTFLSADTEAEVSGFLIENGLGLADGKLRRGGGVYAKDARPLIAYNLFSTNSADMGGGIYLSGCAATVTLNRFELNTANSGGGIYAGGGQVALRINQFRFNTARTRGAAITVYRAESAGILSNVIRENRSFGSAPAIHATGAASIVNSTIVQNVGWGGAVEVVSPDGNVLANNLVAFNDAGGILVEDVTTAPAVRFNNLYRNVTFNYSGIPDPTGTGGNISTEPMMVSAYDLRPRTYSPLVDAGRDSDHSAYDYDADGADRIQGACIDIGAYEAATPKPRMAVRVKPDGNDANDGSTWALAMRTLPAAINRADVLDREVWVAAGRYTGRVTIKDRNVALYGGFKGTEGRRDLRDPSANKTILSGDGMTATTVVIESALHPVDRTTVLDGFTVSEMSVEHTNPLPEILGGGIRILDASPTITNNIISGNTIRTLEGGQGGGIYISGGAPLIAKNTIRQNEAEDGGGLFAWNSDAEIAFNLIAANNARGLDTDPSGLVTTGGGLYVVQGHAVVERNHIFKNWSQDKGGGINSSGNNLTICGNVIEGNTARYGGGMHLGLDTLVHSNLVIGNGAGVNGGGIRGYIGATRIINNTLSDNTAPHGGAIALDSSDARLANNIIAFNSSGLYREAGDTGTPVLAYNDVFGNGGGNYVNVPVGTGDQAVDPLFVDRPYDYRLRQHSLLVEAGDNAWIDFLWLDADGEERRQGTMVDAGAYETATWGIPTWREVATALRMAGGLEAATGHAANHLNAAGGWGLDIRDAGALARQATGLD